MLINEIMKHLKTYDSKWLQIQANKLLTSLDLGKKEIRAIYTLFPEKLATQFIVGNSRNLVLDLLTPELENY